MVKQKTETKRQPLAESSFGKVTSSSSPTDSNESKKEAPAEAEKAPVTTTTSPPVIRRLKYEMCKNWREKGICKYGDKCLFAHGDKELTKRTSAPAVVVEKKTEPTPEKTAVNATSLDKLNLESAKEEEVKITPKSSDSTPTPTFESEAKT